MGHLEIAVGPFRDLEIARPLWLCLFTLSNLPHPNPCFALGSRMILKRSSHLEIAGPFHDPENAHGPSRDCPKSWKRVQHYDKISGSGKSANTNRTLYGAIVSHVGLHSRPTLFKSPLHFSQVSLKLMYDDDNDWN